jgi:hypothetical protein
MRKLKEFIMKIKDVVHQAKVLEDILTKNSLSKDYKATLKDLLTEKMNELNEFYKSQPEQQDNPFLK